MRKRSQQIAEFFKHHARSCRVGLDVIRNGIQRIEQKMRMELGLETLQLCFAHQALDLRLLNFLIAQETLIFE